MYTDSHAHLQMDPFEGDREEVFARATEAQVDVIINIALGPEKEKLLAGIKIAEGRKNLFAAIGVHPHDAKNMNPETLPLLKELATHPKVVAIGEIGLDYFYSRSPHDCQRERFEEMMDLAITLKKPVTLHSRDAFEDTYLLTKSCRVFEKVGGVLHCFTGSREEAKKYLDLGAYISFSGIVTFSKAVHVHEAARMVPLDRLLIETDSPYLSPEPHRGKRNEPANVVRVAQAIAKLKNSTTEIIGQHTTQNTAKLFQFDLLA